MDITHPGQQLMFYFDVIIDLFHYIFYCLLHIFKLLLFYLFICVIGSNVVYLCLTKIISVILILSIVPFFVFCFLFFCFAAIQLARQVQYECTQMVCSNKVARKRKVPNVLFFFFGIHTASAPSTAGMHTDGGAVIRKPGSAGLEDTPAMDLGHMNVVLK